MSTLPKKKTTTTTTTTTVPVKPPVMRKQKQGPKQKQQTNNSKAGAAFGKKYLEVLADPFNAEPVLLGFGTMVDTQMGIARISSLQTAGTDGTCLLMAKPNAQNPLAYSNAINTSAPNWTSLVDSSWSVASAAFSAARPISLGIRVTPLSAATDKPSRAVAINFNYVVNTTSEATSFDSFTANGWFGSHLATKFVLPSGGGKTLTTTWRPMSLQNFEFNKAWLNDEQAGSSTFPLIGPTIVVSIQGPVSMQYDVEVVYLYEALPLAGTVMTGSDRSKTGAGYFPSVDSLFNFIRPHLNMKNAATLVDVVSASGIGLSQSYHLSKGMNTALAKQYEVPDVQHCTPDQLTEDDANHLYKVLREYDAKHSHIHQESTLMDRGDSSESAIYRTSTSSTSSSSFSPFVAVSGRAPLNPPEVVKRSPSSK